MFDQVVGYLKETYGEFTPVRLTGGYTNETFLLKGTRPPLVAKVAHLSNQDLKNEINTLKTLLDIEIVPQVFDLLEFGQFQIGVMEFRSGINGQSILEKGDLERTKEIYKRLGEALSNSIHTIKYTHAPHGIRECNIYELDLDLDFVPDHLRQASKEILKQIRLNKEEWVLTHGDFGIHNVLISANSKLTVLDWEWAEWADPLTDLCWVCWFTALHYPDYAKTLNILFLEAYQRQQSVDLSTEKVKAYTVYKVWKLLNKVKTATDEVQQEWVRRLDWTLKTELFTF